MLKTRDYDLWSMRMEQYLTHTDYALWKVIIIGDSSVPEPPAVGTVVSPKTKAQKLARKKELKAKNTLLLAIFDEHLLKFHSIKDAKSLWEASKIRSEGLDKTYDRFQKLISQLELNGEVISQKDANMKLLRSLPPAWNNIVLIMRNKPDIETLSMDDFYNNLKVYEAEIKGRSSSGSNSHNVAFLSSENTSNINETVNATHDIPTDGSKEQLLHQAIPMILTLMILEEMHLKSQVAMITMRVKKFMKRTGRNLNFNCKEPVGFDKTKVECYNCHRRGHFARKCRTPRNQGNMSTDNKRRIVPVETPANDLVTQQIHQILRANLEILGYQYGLESLEERIRVYQKNETVFKESIAFLKYDVQVRDISSKDLKNQLEETMKEKDDLKEKLTKFEESSKNLTKLVNSQMSANDKTGLGYDNQLSENKMPKYEIFETASDSNVKLDDSVFKFKISESRTSVHENESIPSKSSEEIREEPKTVRNFVPTTVATKSGQMLVNAAKQNSEASANTARPKVNTAAIKPKCEIKREFSVARTPQQNGVGERKNRTLIEAARTMLADSLLPTTFWVEPVNTTCYVQNRVLVTKPYNKTPYELLIGRSPNLEFMKPFGCLVTILNTLDHLGKLDGKADEGFLVGYSVNSKEFKVFNSRTRKVEENLHVKFLENKTGFSYSKLLNKL
nr:retrovirus-related Pol polyprotein from transposon TNT 1-94 [Tanacetum cinerariifolium]